jgi:hypothetical protein
MVVANGRIVATGAYGSVRDAKALKSPAAGHVGGSDSKPYEVVDVAEIRRREALTRGDVFDGGSPLRRRRSRLAPRAHDEDMLPPLIVAHGVRPRTPAA